MPSGIPSSVGHPGHRGQVLLGQGESGPDARRACREQPDGLVPGQLVAYGVVRGQVKRLNPPDGLAADPQRLAAGGDDPQPRAPGQQQLHERGAVADLMLAGVEEQQHVPRAQRLGQRLSQRDTRFLEYPDRGRHQLGGRTAPVGRLDQPGLVEIGPRLIRAGDHLAG